MSFRNSILLNFGSGLPWLLVYIGETGGGNRGQATLHTFRCLKRTAMLIKRDEMIEEFERQIRTFGGAWSEWCVGTAKDARGPFSPI